jgi:hypothetical protein
MPHTPTNTRPPDTSAARLRICARRYNDEQSRLYSSVRGGHRDRSGISVERPGKGAGFTTVCGCPVAARCQSLLSRIFFTRPHHLSTSPFSRSTLVYTTVFLSFKLKEGRFGVALASYPHYPSWVYPKTGRTVPKRGRSDAAAPPLRHKCTRRDAWHGASHTRRRQKRRADHAWRENQLLGLTQTICMSSCTSPGLRFPALRRCFRMLWTTIPQPFSDPTYRYSIFRAAFPGGV